MLLECEALTGVDMLKSAHNIIMPSAATMRALLWSAMSRDGCKWSPVEIGAKLRSPKIASQAQEAIRQAFKVSMPEPDEKKSKKNEDEDSRYTASTSSTPQIPTWIETWAAARIELSLTDVEFLSMTPKMLYYLRRSSIHEKQWLEVQVSRIIAYNINFSACHPKEPVKPDVFMIHRFDNTESTDQDLGTSIMNLISGAKRKFDTNANGHNGTGNINTKELV